MERRRKMNDSGYTLFDNEYDEDYIEDMVSYSTQKDWNHIAMGVFFATCIISFIILCFDWGGAIHLSAWSYSFFAILSLIMLVVLLIHSAIIGDYWAFELILRLIVWIAISLFDRD